ncbi:MAG: hypothetical protein IPJ30_23120 [Acidobacteria bacterium]|nr:hypothetical protein [Acidobacteriota bacterium]
MIADVGLVGFRMPEIDFDFGDLRREAEDRRLSVRRSKPNLGVVDLGDFKTFVVADIPWTDRKARQRARGSATVSCATSNGRS